MLKKFLDGREWIVLAALVIASIIAIPVASAQAAPAKAHVARSYHATAVNKANRWAYNRYATALYIYSQCYSTGYKQADCSIELTKSWGSCSVSVTVTGRYYRVRRYDTTC